MHITHSLQNRPYSMYPCVLFNHPGQSFRLLHSELLSGKDLGSVIGGDLALQSALSRLSTLYWEQQDAYEAEFSEKERAIPPNAINSEVNLSLIGNGAVCSAYSVRLFSFGSRSDPWKERFFSRRIDREANPSVSA